MIKKIIETKYWITFENALREHIQSVWKFPSYICAILLEKKKKKKNF